MGQLSVEAQAKEGVLIGAKCLSCNRVYDEEVRNANQVDLHHEKQQLQVLAQLQQQLNASRGDVAGMKVVTIKMGKPKQAVGSDGQAYDTRDPAFGFALPDVALVQKSPKKKPPEDYKYPLRKLVGRPREQSASQLAMNMGGGARQLVSSQQLDGTGGGGVPRHSSPVSPPRSARF